MPARNEKSSPKTGRGRRSLPVMPILGGAKSRSPSSRLEMRGNAGLGDQTPPNRSEVDVEEGSLAAVGDACAAPPAAPRPREWPHPDRADGPRRSPAPCAREPPARGGRSRLPTRSARKRRGLCPSQGVGPPPRIGIQLSTPASRLREAQNAETGEAPATSEPSTASEGAGEPSFSVRRDAQCSSDERCAFERGETLGIAEHPPSQPAQ